MDRQTKELEKHIRRVAEWLEKMEREGADSEMIEIGEALLRKAGWIGETKH